MTPGARVAAAAEILDRILAGTPAEQALTTWARGNRFAGSGDRAAIRDHVFDALRRRESSAALGGGRTGRALMIGLLRGQGVDPATLFTGQGHAPAVLTEAEATLAPEGEGLPDPVRLDYPDWAEGHLRDSLGAEFEPVMACLRARAPVFARVNLSRGTRAAAVHALQAEGVVAVPHPLAETALEVTSGARGLRLTRALADGLVDLQDASSQAVVAAILAGGIPGRVLDYCAGGGGKSLALADRGARVLAHDADPGRMTDLPARAERAGVRIERVTKGEAQARAPFDLVVTDVPCSGSGAWRRQPEARWTLTPARFAELCDLQETILNEAAGLVVPGGRLAYVTCSLLRAENEDRVSAFLAGHPGWVCAAQRRWLPTGGGDGFFLAVLGAPG